MTPDMQEFVTSPVGGRYFRVVDWHWHDPLDASHSARPPGGRWNPAGLPCLYLNADVQTARANALHRFAGRPVSIDDVDPASAPHLVEVEVPPGTAADAFSEAGLKAVGLPSTYPREPDGTVVPHSRCQPIGRAAVEAGLNGIDCRSAAPGGTRELAWFADTGTPRLVSRRPQPQWW